MNTDIGGFPPSKSYDDFNPYKKKDQSLETKENPVDQPTSEGGESQEFSSPEDRQKVFDFNLTGSTSSSALPLGRSSKRLKPLSKLPDDGQSYTSSRGQYNHTSKSATDSSDSEYSTPKNSRTAEAVKNAAKNAQANQEQIQDANKIQKRTPEKMEKHDINFPAIPDQQDVTKNDIEGGTGQNFNFKPPRKTKRNINAKQQPQNNNQTNSTASSESTVKTFRRVSQHNKHDVDTQTDNQANSIASNPHNSQSQGADDNNTESASEQGKQDSVGNGSKTIKISGSTQTEVNIPPSASDSQQLNSTSTTTPPSNSQQPNSPTSTAQPVNNNNNNVDNNTSGIDLAGVFK
ncbi:MAG: hypothetical protein K2L13_01010, partial [Opitutales bacterium]|nr:hypothetical protein [Opitutales bacterium]